MNSNLAQILFNWKDSLIEKSLDRIHDFAKEMLRASLSSFAFLIGLYKYTLSDKQQNINQTLLIIICLTWFFSVLSFITCLFPKTNIGYNKSAIELKKEFNSQVEIKVFLAGIGITLYIIVLILFVFLFFP